MVSYECKKPGNTKFECPRLKMSFKLKKKGLVASLDESKSDFGAEEHANLCLMVDIHKEVYHATFCLSKI